VKIVWAKDAGAAIGVLERVKPEDSIIGIMLDHDLDKKLRSAESRLLSGSDVVAALLRNPKAKASRSWFTR